MWGHRRLRALAESANVLAKRATWFLVGRQDDTGVVVRGQKFDASALLRSPYATGYFVIVEGSDYVISSAQTS